MAAAVLRSTVRVALRRATAASSSSAAGANNANARAVRRYYGYGGRSRYDAQAYTDFFPPTKRDKADWYFDWVAFLGACFFVGLVNGEYRFWVRRDTSTRPPPRMTTGRRGR